MLQRCSVASAALQRSTAGVLFAILLASCGNHAAALQRSTLAASPAADPRVAVSFDAELGCPTESRLSLSCFRLEQSVRLEACHFSVGVSQSGVFALRAQSGSGAGPVGTQSGFPSRAQSGFGPSRDSPVGILPSRDFSSRAPVGIPSRASRPSRAPVGISSCPVGTVLPVGPQSGFVRPQSGPSRTA